VTGYWSGDVKAVKYDKSKVKSADALKPLKLPEDDAYFDMLRKPYQAFILETLMAGTVGFDGKDGQLKLMLNGKSPKAITTLKRPSQVHFAEQLQWLRAYADLREDRLAEIQMQLGDALSFFGAQSYLNDGRRQHTLMLLDIVRNFAIHIETPMKYYCRSARPIDYAAEVQPMIQTPEHSSFPSGHALEAFAIATVFYRLQTGYEPAAGISGAVLKQGRSPSALPFRLAHRIAVNRTVAGVHFPVDSRVGAHVGCTVGDLVWSLASGKDLATGNPSLGRADADFLLSDTDFSPVRKGQAVKVKPIPMLRKLWNLAAAEWPLAPARI
jgi:membrane-associated phospholipid phosphatase